MYQWKDFVVKCYADQAKAFLNAYWDECGDSAEDVWNWAHKFAELDLDKQEQGCDLDEFGAHRFLESIGETKTVKEMRQALTETDLDFNKRIALLEYCLWKNNKSIKEFTNRPQGDPTEVQKAQRLLEEVQEALKESKAKAEAAREADKQAAQAAKEAKAAEADATAKKEASLKAAADAKEKEAQAAADAAEAKEKEAAAAADAAAAKAAADELRAALAELKAQEDAYNNKTETLKKKSTEGGVVTRNKAKAELEIHLAEDPLPLRTAKITQEAATRKAEKAQAQADASHKEAADTRKEAEESHSAAVASRQAADEAAEQATAAANAATAAREAAEESAKAASAARAEADAAVDACLAKFAEAEAALEEVKKNAVQKGHVWWVERELHEAKKYMPMKKGGIARK